MFDQLFSRPHALLRQRSGPLLRERLAYLRYLADQGMAHSTMRCVAEYLLAVADYLRLQERPDAAVGQSEIERAAHRWAKRRTKSARPAITRESSRRRFVWAATQWLGFMDRLQTVAIPQSPWAESVVAFADYLARERGLSSETINARCWIVRDFLQRLGTRADALRELTIVEIDRALVDKITQCGYARVTVQSYAGALRSFFGYAEIRDWCRPGLATAIKGPRIFPQERLPTGPSWDDVQRLLAMTQGDRPTDIRDRAILLLLAVYGLRSGELVRLRLEDFDWERELLRVTRYKTSGVQLYPLDGVVGDAVLRYLREVRPRSSCREVFLTRRAPFRPMGGGLWRIVAVRLRHLGVVLPHHGAHALRHACATRLMARGLSLKEIGDHLGHRHPDTTRVYAKVDLAGLRAVADVNLGGLL
jgi:site-specific recombinase XerD